MAHTSCFLNRVYLLTMLLTGYPCDRAPSPNPARPLGDRPSLKVSGHGEYLAEDGRPGALGREKRILSDVVRVFSQNAGRNGPKPEIFTLLSESFALAWDGSQDLFYVHVARACERPQQPWRSACGWAGR